MIHPQKENQIISSQNLTIGQFVCVNCGQIMMQRQCKVRCMRCGYFEDCSDGGNDPSNYVVLKKDK